MPSAEPAETCSVSNCTTVLGMSPFSPWVIRTWVKHVFCRTPRHRPLLAHLRQPIRGTQPLRVRFRSARYARLRSTSPSGVGWQQPESNLQKGFYTGCSLIPREGERRAVRCSDCYPTIRQASAGRGQSFESQFKSCSSSSSRRASFSSPPRDKEPNPNDRATRDAGRCTSTASPATSRTGSACSRSTSETPSRPKESWRTPRPRA